MDSKDSFEQFFTKKNGGAPEFTLINQDGKKVSLKDFRGKVVVMTYIYTTCTFVCPLLEAKFLDIQNVYKKKLGNDLILISLTMDIDRDNYAYEINGLLPATDPLIWKLMEMLEGFRVRNEICKSE